MNSQQTMWHFSTTKNRMRKFSEWEPTHQKKLYYIPNAIHKSRPVPPKWFVCRQICSVHNWNWITSKRVYLFFHIIFDIVLRFENCVLKLVSLTQMMKKKPVAPAYSTKPDKQQKLFGWKHVYRLNELFSGDNNASKLSAIMFVL